MPLQNKKIILTGAAGGIAAALIDQLLPLNNRLALLDVNEKALQQYSSQSGVKALIACDLSTPEGCKEAIEQAIAQLEGVDVLINLAGIMSFSPYEQESPERISQLIQINLIAPMLLSRQVLPTMLKQKKGRIINIGSIFGSIGFAYFTAYSTSKFGLRGFSEALRRELHGTSVRVNYIAPRAVKTALNNSEILRMGKATNMKLDSPEKVAKCIVQSVKKERAETFIGFPESLFVRINAVFSGVVDKALRAQNQVAKKYAYHKEKA